MWQCSNKYVGYLPIFYNRCDLKRVSLLGVEPPTFPVDSLQPRGKQWHHPMGWSTAARPYLIHAKAFNKSGSSCLKSSYGQDFLYFRPVQQKTDDCKAKRRQKNDNVQRNRGWTPIVELLPAGTQPVAHIPTNIPPTHWLKVEGDVIDRRLILANGVWFARAVVSPLLLQLANASVTQVAEERCVRFGTLWLRVGLNVQLVSQDLKLQIQKFILLIFYPATKYAFIGWSCRLFNCCNLCLPLNLPYET